jgi:rare lipoprotein A
VSGPGVVVMICRRRILSVFALLYLLTASSHTFAATRTFSGLASYYSYKGGQSASGQKYDAQALTAAHRSLPFGTRVRVTNPSSGKSVIVTINDRGPFKASRVIDVSTSAAKQLDMIEKGIIYVRAEVL